MEHHGDHHNGGDHLRGIGHGGHHVSRAHTRNAVGDLVTAQPDHGDDGKVLHHHQHGVDHRHQLLHTVIYVTQLAVGGAEALAFVILTHVGLNHTGTADVLLHHAIDTVQALLHHGEHGHGLTQHHGKGNGHHGDRRQQHHAKADVQGQQEEGAADHKEGGAYEHTQDHFHKFHDHRNVVGHTGHKRARGKLVGLLDGKRHHTGVGVTAQVVPKALGGLGRRPGAQGAEKAAHQRDQQHQHAKGNDHVHTLKAAGEQGVHNACRQGVGGNVLPDDAVVDDKGHQIGQTEVGGHLQDHQNGRENGKMPIGL